MGSEPGPGHGVEANAKGKGYYRCHKGDPLDDNARVSQEEKRGPSCLGIDRAQLDDAASPLAQQGSQRGPGVMSISPGPRFSFNSADNATFLFAQNDS